MPQVYLHAAARGDLVEHFVYLSENAGLDTAERFLNRVEASFEDLRSNREWAHRCGCGRRNSRGYASGAYAISTTT